MRRTKRKMFLVIAAWSAAILIGIALVAMSAQVARTRLPPSVSMTGTVEAVAPNVRITNTSLIARSGQPTSIDFSVSAAPGSTIEFVIAKNGTVPSTGLMSAGEISLPPGVSVQHPGGKSLSGPQGVASVRLTLTDTGTARVQVPLELVVAASLATPGQAIITVVPFVVTVTP
jgi:hypothetical protein